MSGEYWFSDKAKTERKINRIKDVYLYIKKHGPIRTKELIDEFEMSRRTLERDLDTLLFNELIKNPKRGFWAVTDKKVKGENHV